MYSFVNVPKRDSRVKVAFVRSRAGLKHELESGMEAGKVVRAKSLAVPAGNQFWLSDGKSRRRRPAIAPGNVGQRAPIRESVGGLGQRLNAHNAERALAKGIAFNRRFARVHAGMQPVGLCHRYAMNVDK